MKLFVCAFLAMMVCACLVQVQAGFSDFFGGHKDHDDDDDHEEKKKGHYEGGIGKQVVHTLVDGGAARLADMAEERFDNPLMTAAIVGVEHKLKNKVHEKINDFGEDGEEHEAEDDDHHHHDDDDERHREDEERHREDDERHREDDERHREEDEHHREEDEERHHHHHHDDVDEQTGMMKSGNFFSRLLRRRRSVTEHAKGAAMAGLKAAGKHMMSQTLGLGGDKSADKNTQASGGVASKLMEGAKNLVGVGSASKKDDDKKADDKKEESKEEKKDEGEKAEDKKEEKKE